MLVYRDMLVTLRILTPVLTAVGTHWRPSSIQSDIIRFTCF